MALYLYDSKLLTDSGKLTTSEDCCCNKEVPCPIPDCCYSFYADVVTGSIACGVVENVDVAKHDCFASWSVNNLDLSNGTDYPYTISFEFAEYSNGLFLYNISISEVSSGYVYKAPPYLDLGTGPGVICDPQGTHNGTAYHASGPNCDDPVDTLTFNIEWSRIACAFAQKSCVAKDSYYFNNVDDLPVGSCPEFSGYENEVLDPTLTSIGGGEWRTEGWHHNKYVQVNLLACDGSGIPNCSDVESWESDPSFKGCVITIYCRDGEFGGSLNVVDVIPKDGECSASPIGTYGIFSVSEV